MQALAARPGAAATAGGGGAAARAAARRAAPAAPRRARCRVAPPRAPWPPAAPRRGPCAARAQLQPQRAQHAPFPRVPLPQPHLARPPRQQQQRKQPPAVLYIPNFLHPDDAETILQEYRKLR
jgi:hypothetical protein